MATVFWWVRSSDRFVLDFLSGDETETESIGIAPDLRQGLFSWVLAPPNPPFIFENKNEKEAFAR